MTDTDRTNPVRKNEQTGRGRGRRRRQGQGRGWMGGPFAAGPGGDCVCPNCGNKIAHVAGKPCNQQTCPKCGVRMTRG
jgi:hypothetical protein